jgi:predicted nucleotidyltransferase component of viral defense system
MREYATPVAFRVAVEAKLRQRARQLGIPAYILRRQAGLERLMVRLMTVAPGRWAVKGGFALETRLGARARVSVDLDADHLRGAGAARVDLQRAAIAEVGDHFSFAVTGSEELRARRLDPVLAMMRG